MSALKQIFSRASQGTQRYLQEMVDDPLHFCLSGDGLIAYDADELRDLLAWKNPVVKQGLEEIMKAAKKRETCAHVSPEEESMDIAVQYFKRHGYICRHMQSADGEILLHIEW